MAARHAMAVEAATRFGLAVETTAEAALCDALNLAEGRVQYYLAQVAELTPGQLTGGFTRVTRRVKPEGQAGAGRLVEDVTVAKSEPHVLLRLLDAAEKHRVQVAEVMARLNVEHRRVEIAQEQGNLFYEVLLGVLAEYGIRRDDPQLAVIVPQVVAELTDGPLSTTAAVEQHRDVPDCWRAWNSCPAARTPYPA